MNDKEFINTFNEYYPFERYIVKNPKRINYFFDDVLLTELFVPSTEIKPVVYDGGFTDFTRINDELIYIKLMCKDECNDNYVEFRMAYYDFDNHIREEIRHIIISDFGGYEWESLYVEHEEDDECNELKEELQIQKQLIKDKYGVCNIKDNFEIEDTIHLIY
jgi:hypothetical protein